jgi:hypothetical protein
MSLKGAMRTTCGTYPASDILMVKDMTKYLVYTVNLATKQDFITTMWQIYS